MATTTKNLSAYALIVEKLNFLYDRHGDLSTLTTAEKGTFVSAINELHALITANTSSAVQIDDANQSTTTVYSSDKTRSVMLQEIAIALEGEDLSDLAASVVANAQADANFISVGGLQSFTAAQQLQGRQNIGAASQVDLDSANTDIATNTTDIATNTADIATNTTAVAANTTATAANLTLINAVDAALGNEATYDPVASINALITF